MSEPLIFTATEIGEAVRKAADESAFKYTADQIAAAIQILGSKITRIEGRTGTGRTQTFRLVVAAWKYLTASKVDERAEILLLAYTGKAAKILSEVVGASATTLHSAFGIDAKSSVWHGTSPLPHGLVLFEDDARLECPAFTEALLNACPSARIAISFDPDQLRSGSLFIVEDKTVRLTEVFRQTELA